MPQVTGEEAVIAIIPDETDEHRLVFVAKPGSHPLPIILRQESYSPGVGWFTQSQIEMTRQQMVMLRATLGTSSNDQARIGQARMGSHHRRQRAAVAGRRIDADPTPLVLPFSSNGGMERKGA